jgi:hypothetical protein
MDSNPGPKPLPPEGADLLPPAETAAPADPPLVFQTIARLNLASVARRTVTPTTTTPTTTTTTPDGSTPPEGGGNN